MSAQHPGESYRGVIAARCTADGGGPCTLIVRRVADRIELLFHGVVSTGADMSEIQADELTGHLMGATRPPGESGGRR